LNVAVFRQKGHLCHTVPYSHGLAPADFWLFPELKSVLKGKHFLDIEDIKSPVKKNLTDIPVQDFKNCFDQWSKCWEHYEDWREITLKNCRLLISAALKILKK
jgi:hypothetical protein